MLLILINFINKILGRPLTVSSKNILVRYNKKTWDGVIFLRRGVRNISLGDVDYAQTRIVVDNKYFIKGMAIYKDDDYCYFNNKDIQIIINTALSEAEYAKVFKPLRTKENGKINWKNPFGCTIKRRRGALNIVSEQGDWVTWSVQDE